MTTLRILSGADIRRAVSMTEIIGAMKTAFTGLATGEQVMPARAHIDTEVPEATALFMPSYMKQVSMFGMKTITILKDNGKKGLPAIQGMVCLFDAETGSPLAILDGQTITALRTGAASGLATDLLAREDAKVVAIFGAGSQARTQLEAVCAVRKIEKVFVCNRTIKSAQLFAKEMEEQLGVEIVIASTAEQAVAGADIICTATSSNTPVFDDRDLKAGVHINAVGSYKPDVQEVPEEMILRSKLVVDHKESALEETGDLIIPIGKGVFTEAHIHAELGEIVTGAKMGRETRDEMTFFKSVGVAVQDLSSGAAVYHNAVSKGIGVVVEL